MLLVLFSRPAFCAADRQNLLALHEAVVAFVHAQHPADADLEVLPDRLDPRLRLSPCEGSLEAFWSPGSAELGQTTVGVRCDGTKPWKLFLPTRVKLLQPVVVASRPLARGQRLGKDDLALEKRDLGTLRGKTIQNPTQVLGYLMRRGVPAGRALHTALLEAPVLVERGRRVRMAVQAQSIDITMTGVALEDGALGETVRVRNPASSRVVEGVVVGPAQVRLELRPALRKTSSRQ